MKYNSIQCSRPPSGRDQREIHVQARNTAVSYLLDLLKLAAIRVGITYGGCSRMSYNCRGMR
jgi:Fe-S cluster assembly iron-binding protein IscA